MFIVGGVIGVVGAAVISHSNYSRYSRYRDHSDYSDAAEQRRRKIEAKTNDLQRSKVRLKEYIDEAINALKEKHQLEIETTSWPAEQAKFIDFSQDYGVYEDKLKEKVKKDLAAELAAEIRQDENDIKEIDKIIMRINKIKLTQIK